MENIENIENIEKNTYIRISLIEKKMKKLILLSATCFGFVIAGAQTLPVKGTYPSISYQTVTASVNEITIDKAIKIYPNPAVNELNVVSQNGFEINNCSYYVYDNSGKLILSEKNTSFQNKSLHVNIENLQNGLYTLIIITTGKSATISKKFIINK